MIVCTVPYDGEAFNLNVCQVHAVSLETGDRVTLDTIRKKHARAVATSPSGCRVAVGFSDGQVRLYKADTLEREWHKPTTGVAIDRVVSACFVTPALLVVAYQSSKLAYLDLDRPRAAMTLVGLPQEPVDVIPVDGTLIVPTKVGLTVLPATIPRKSSRTGPDGLVDCGVDITLATDHGPIQGAAVVDTRMVLFTESTRVTLPIASITGLSGGDRNVIHSITPEVLDALPGALHTGAWGAGARVLATMSDLTATIMAADPTLTAQRTVVGADDDAEFSDVTFVGDGYIAAASTTNAVQLVDSTTARTTLLRGHTDMVLALAGRAGVLASGARDRAVRVWHQASPDAPEWDVNLLTGHARAVTGVAWFKGNRALLASVSEDRTLKVWRWLGGDVTASEVTVDAHAEAIHCVAVHPKDAFIVTGAKTKLSKGTKDNLKLWPVEHTAVGGRDVVRLGGPRVLRGHRRGVWNAAFHPHGRLLATAGDHDVRLWAIPGGECVATLKGHGSTVLAVTFVTDGRQVLSCDADGVACLWSVVSHECVWKTEAHGDRIWGLDSIDDGARLVTAAGVELKLWEDNTEAVDAEARAKQDGVLEGQHAVDAAITMGDWSTAIGTGLELDHSRQTLKTVDAMIARQEVDALEEVLSELSRAMLGRLWGYCKAWGMRPRSAPASTAVLGAMLTQYTPESLLELTGVRDSAPGMLTEARKTFGRLDRLYADTFLIEMAIGGMAAIESDAPVEA